MGENNPWVTRGRVVPRSNQHRYPALASLARDVLSIPTTGMGVERLFNSARDICHYCCGSLNATTIQDLIMFMCTSRFEINKRQLADIKQFLPESKIEELNEEQSTQLLDDVGQISDTEENELAVTKEQWVIQEPSSRALGKRQRSVASELEDEVDLPPLLQPALRPLPRPRPCPRAALRGRRAGSSCPQVGQGREPALSGPP